MMRFIRFLMLLAGGMFLLAVLRTIMGAFKTAVTQSPTAAQPRQPEVATSGELKKCAACGTYNTVQNSVTKLRANETVYYCSNDCRARHAA